MKQAKFIVIHGRKDIDSFMKAADLFNYKNLGLVENITVTYSDRITLSFEYASKTINVLKEGLERAGEIVSFVHLLQIQNNENITLNTKIKPFYDDQAREISDGTKSFVLKDFIESNTPFTCETNEIYLITKLI